jgi:hypothetical protein
MDLRTRDNITVWNSDLQGGHVESYFLKLNDPAQHKAFWIKFTIYSPKGHPEKAVGEVWGIVFDAASAAVPVAFKETFPIGECKLAASRFELQFGACTLQDGKTSGRLSGPQGQLSWDLSFTPGEAALSHFPMAWMYKAKIPKSKIKTPYPASRFSGSVTLNNAVIQVRDVPGMQGHNWGSEHSHLYAWSHCSAFEGHGDDTFFEGFSSRIKIGPWVSPFLSMAVLSLRGRRYMWNDWKALRSPNVLVENNRWKFEIRGAEHSLVGTIQAPTNRFIALNYYNPSGALSYCLNSKIAGGDIELRDARGNTIETLRAKETFALEVLVKNKNHGVAPGV